MAEANLIPGATQIFADVLEGGDVKKLFANMQKGKYTLQDIVKVLDSLQSKIKQDQLDKMLNRPSAELAELETAWQRFVGEVNKSGGLDLMKSSLNFLTDVIKTLTKIVQPLKNIFSAMFGIFSTTFGNIFTYLKMIGGIIRDVFMSPFTGNFTTDLLRMIPIVGVLLGVLWKFPSALTLIEALGMILWRLGMQLWRFFLVPAAVIGAILLVEDLIQGLLGNDSVIANAAKEGGAVGTIAATFMMIGESLSTLGQLIVSVFSGDLGLAKIYLQEWLDKFKSYFPEFSKWLVDLFPIDAWMQGLDNFFVYWKDRLKLLGSALAVSWNPLSSKAEAAKAWKDYENFTNTRSMFSTSPTNNTTNNGTLQIPQTISLVVNAESSDPNKIANVVEVTLRDTLDKMNTQAMANYTNWRFGQ